VSGGRRLGAAAVAALAVVVTGALAVGVDARPAASEARSPFLGPRPLQTGVFPITLPESPLVLSRVRAAGTSVVRFVLNWQQVAVRRPTSSAVARDPSFSGYDWHGMDDAVRWAAASGLQPVMSVLHPPSWAADMPPKVPHGPWNVDAEAFADFVYAAATRYNGLYAGLPRVRYWVVWNEPNFARYLNPQFVDGKPQGGHLYRPILNAAADAIHAARRDNVVVAGATGPFTQWTPSRRERWGVGPLTFLRTLLCLSAKLKPTCSERAKFDVWAHNPYTSGGPQHEAARPADVSLGDLPEMRAVLDAAVKHKKIVSRKAPKFWVTEFSWDTSPPDREGVPKGLHARWVAEALYQAWRSGVSLFIWWSLRDQPYPSMPWQAGLYFNGGTDLSQDRPKPALQAFRFPFVAYLRGGAVFTWGRTVGGRRARVRIEQRFGSVWRSLGVVRTNRFGIFSRTFVTSGRGHLRARELGRAETSRTFSLTRPKDRFFYPFGDFHP
jgi:hypothetical protein